MVVQLIENKIVRTVLFLFINNHIYNSLVPYSVTKQSLLGVELTDSDLVHQRFDSELLHQVVDKELLHRKINRDLIYQMVDSNPLYLQDGRQ